MNAAPRGSAEEACCDRALATQARAVRAYKAQWAWRAVRIALVAGVAWLAAPVPANGDASDCDDAHRCAWSRVDAVPVAARHAETPAPRVLRVGPGRALASPSAAARVARDGDVVEIDAGEYAGDTAVWTQRRLVLRARRGRVRLVAGGRLAEDKAIWVIRGDDVVVDGIAFVGARATDRNGAGIRHEGGRLAVRHCEFAGNEMGLLTSNDPQAELDVEASELHHNAVTPSRPGGPIGHQLYVGAIARFTLRDSYVHDGMDGHLVKSRARESTVVGNLLADGPDGHASYELEFPQGGVARVAGNVVRQGPGTHHPAIVAFGAEGYRWPRNTLALVHNTLVDDVPGGGTFLRIARGADRVVLIDNLFVGAGAIGALFPPGTGNARAARRDLVAPDAHDYRLREDSPLIGTAVPVPDHDDEMPAVPMGEDRRPGRSTRSAPGASSPGAIRSIAVRAGAAT